MNRLDSIDLSLSLKNEDSYRTLLESLQSRIKALQTACYHNGHQVVILLEGWDASGKGGAIRRLAEKLDPRSYQVHPIGKPNALEQREHYLQRFWRKIPAKGHIGIFDRSWYGRVLVERVEGLISEAVWQRAYEEINNFEKNLTDSGIVVIKFFLHISQEEQLRRYEERLGNPNKHWKLTEEDLRNRQQADQYALAYEAMFEQTDTTSAPWRIVAGEHKWYARTQVLQLICDTLEAHIDTSIPRYSKEEIEETRRLLGLD